ncbi:MAG TPA: geranylgeranylglycerol-phosphate geranylgeranyltransferase [Bacteroidales bacterium]|nr:geranylgeranylglycerol-phosphate geranylgeranyltransferase [Bacteroidales bacterium]
MKEFLTLIRWQNLLIVILTQVLVCYAIVAPLAGLMPVEIRSTGIIESIALQLPWYDFAILLLATTCITAGGYVINDYFDIRSDLINRGEVIVGTKIPRRKAMMWHNILNIAGVSAGFFVSYRIGYFWAGIIFILVSGLLYFYSATYKRQFLIGNLIVALLTAMVPMLVVLYEIPPIYKHYINLTASLPSLKVIWFWGLGFSSFAFLTTLGREILKDMEDFEGDRAYGSNSVPVVAGIKASKFLVVSILAIVICLLLMVWFQYLNDKLTLIYIIAGLVIPLIYNILLIIRAKRQEDFRKGSTILKVIMFIGISYTFLAYFVIKKNLFL